MSHAAGFLRIGAALALALLFGCNTKQVTQPQVAGADGSPSGSGGSGGINVERKDAPADSGDDAADGPLAPSGCQAADAPKRAPGQACNCASDCAAGTCQEGVCCSGAACGAKRPAGSVCDEPGDCESGFCSDSVCCNVACTGACVSCNQPDHMGECLPVPVGVEDPHKVCRQDAPDTCGQSGVCNGQGGCAKYAAGTVCKLGACEGRDKFVPASTCDGEGTCIHGVAISCAPSTCESGTCVTACRDSNQCMAPALCTAGSCGKRGNGQDCTSADQCGSGFCVQGVCCDGACGGACQTCALPSARGKCSPVPAGASDPKGMCRDMGAASCGDNGKCNGMGACQRYANGTVCQAARCDVSANTETPAGTCQGGRCNVPGARSCAPHRGCSGGRCATSCGNDAQCTPGNICLGGNCGKRPNGATCNTNSQCASGQCAQGRCCATACNDSCKSCAVPGQEGDCANVPARGADPTGTCTDGACTNGCNGSGGCLREAVDASCGAARCGDGGSRILRVCNTSGACVDRGEACPMSAPSCTGAGLCRGNNCTTSNCPGPCRVCVMDSCVDAPPDTSCSGGTCRSGSCVPGTDCQVSAWSDWSTCSRACDGGTQTRTRTVTQPPTAGGQACPALTETRTCNTQPCVQPVDCRVSEWSEWSTCSRTCGGGTQTRTRTILQQPMNGGMACPVLTESRACNTDPCPMPVDCRVSEWSDWGTCSKTCGGGTQTRTRTILQQPMNGGMACPALSESRACNTDPCPMPVDCQVSDWSEWSTCSRPCGGGTQTRTRTVIRQPSNGGMACPALSETRTCNTDQCPECVDGLKECVNMETLRECRNGRWRMMNCNGRTPVCMAGDCVPAGPVP